MHKQVAKYLDLTGLLWFHPPNGGFRRKIDAVNLKLMGVKPGVPDIMIVSPVKIHEHWAGELWRPGVAIELKAQKGRLSSAQRSWRENLEKEGWVYEICRSIPDVISVIEEHYRDRVKCKSKEAK